MSRSSSSSLDSSSIKSVSQLLCNQSTPSLVVITIIGFSFILPVPSVPNKTSIYTIWHGIITSIDRQTPPTSLVVVSIAVCVFALNKQTPLNRSLYDDSTLLSKDCPLFLTLCLFSFTPPRTTGAVQQQQQQQQLVKILRPTSKEVGIYGDRDGFCCCCCCCSRTSYCRYSLAVVEHNSRGGEWNTREKVSE